MRPSSSPGHHPLSAANLPSVLVQRVSGATGARQMCLLAGAHRRRVRCTNTQLRTPLPLAAQYQNVATLTACAFRRVRRAVLTNEHTTVHRVRPASTTPLLDQTRQHSLGRRLSTDFALLEHCYPTVDRRQHAANVRIGRGPAVIHPTPRVGLAASPLDVLEALFHLQSSHSTQRRVHNALTMILHAWELHEVAAVCRRSLSSCPA
jgi:hypothetical protein